MTTPPSIAVVIVNYNGGSMLLKAVESVFEQTETDISLILVDNASVDGSARTAKQRYPSLFLIENSENELFCKAANSGMTHAMESGADYVFLLNNDATILQGTMVQLQEFLNENPQVGACQPLLVFAHDHTVIQSAGCRLSLSGLAWDHLCGEGINAAGRDPFPVLGATGGAMMLRTKALHEVGLFPDFFEMYFEDVDLSLRLHEAGWDIYCIPNALVSHIRSATTDSNGSAMRVFFCERNSYAIVRRHFPLSMACLAIILHCPLSLAAAMLNALRGQRAIAQSMLAGMKAGLSLFMRSGRLRKKTGVGLLVDRRILPPRNR